MSERIYCPYEWEASNGEVQRCLNSANTGRRYFQKSVKFIQHCITTHFERSEVDQIVKKLLRDRYKKGRYVCDICLNKKDLGTKAVYLAHMIEHFKPAEIDFIQQDYIMVETRMDTDTSDEEERRILEDHKRKRRATADKKGEKKKVEKVHVDLAEVEKAEFTRPKPPQRKAPQKLKADPKSFLENIEISSDDGDDPNDSDFVLDDEDESDYDGKSVGSIHTHHSSQTQADDINGECILTPEIENRSYSHYRRFKKVPNVLAPRQWWESNLYPTELGYLDYLMNLVDFSKLNLGK